MKPLTRALTIASLLGCSTLALAAERAPAPDFIVRPPPPFTPTTWVNATTSTLACNGEGVLPCNALAVAPGWMVYDGSVATGPFSHGLFEIDGRGNGPGSPFEYAFPFDCDDSALSNGSPRCESPGATLPCCPLEVQTSPVSLSVDAQGTAWWINSETHHIHYYLAGASQDVDFDAAVNNNSTPWASVAAGAPQAMGTDPLTVGQIWAVSTSGGIYSFYGG
jgi:hypothetical protein